VSLGGPTAFVPHQKTAADFLTHLEKKPSRTTEKRSEPKEQEATYKIYTCEIKIAGCAKNASERGPEAFSTRRSAGHHPTSSSAVL
jgi:hypothetical protein